MSVEIVGATLRDLSYIACNLRPEDKAELIAQFDHWTPTWLAAVSLRDHAYIAEIDGNPEAAFGAGETRRGQYIAWSWMSQYGIRAVPRITRFVRKVMIPDIYAEGSWRVEARCLASNLKARWWLQKMGATEQGWLRNYGTGGEHFLLYEWVREDWNDEASIVQGFHGVHGVDLGVRSMSI